MIQITSRKKAKGGYWDIELLLKHEDAIGHASLSYFSSNKGTNYLSVYDLSFESGSIIQKMEAYATMVTPGLIRGVNKDTQVCAVRLPDDVRDFLNQAAVGAYSRDNVVSYQQNIMARVEHIRQAEKMARRVA